MDTSIGTVIAEKIKDFAEEGLPEVFDRDLSLGRIQPPTRGNLVNVIVGVRRCGKTYRLYQEMRRIVAEGYPQDSILYFNFEDERLKPYEKELLQEVIEVFYARNPARGKRALSSSSTRSRRCRTGVCSCAEWSTLTRRPYMRLAPLQKCFQRKWPPSSAAALCRASSFLSAFPNSFAIRGMRRLLRTTPLLPSALSQATCARICDTTAAST